MTILDEMPDPTYHPDRINEKPEWKIAFTLSELFNDRAPLGWTRFVPLAEKIIKEAETFSREEVVETDFKEGGGI